MDRLAIDCLLPNICRAIGCWLDLLANPLGVWQDVDRQMVAVLGASMECQWKCRGVFRKPLSSVFEGGKMTEILIAMVRK